MLALSALLAILALALVGAQQNNQTLQSSWPHLYPGIPNTDNNFTDSKAWQKYFLVKHQLPNVTFTMPRTFAGNLPVNRPGHPNNTLFFVAFEHTHGSLTCSENDHRHKNKPWIIWLNGGPGSSSMLGSVYENGPMLLNDDNSPVKNKYSWHTLADVVYIDQPTGTGFSTSDSQGYISSEDQMGEDMMRFLHTLTEVFPALAKRPLHLMGESYAGVYIPYIVKTYFSMKKPPVHLAKIAMGDGSMGSDEAALHSPILSVIETYPQTIDYDADVYKYFKEQRRLCGYDLNLTYPQHGYFPTLRLAQLSSSPSSFQIGGRLKGTRFFTQRAFDSVLARVSKRASGLSKRELASRAERRASLKRDLSQRANGSIDPFYECLLLYELYDFMVNFTKPWSLNDPYPADAGVDVYSTPDALNPEAFLPQRAESYFNDPVTRSALHAPTSMNWSAFINYPFDNNPNNALNPGTNAWGDPSPVPSTFLTELATNCSRMNVSIIFYSGNDDSLLPHRGTEIAIQNMTFGGTQGFSQPPSTAWYGDDGKFAGIVHQERGVTYALFDKTGHLVPRGQPSHALTFVREYVLGSNRNGSVTSNGTVGVSHPLPGGILPGEHNPIFTGSGTTMGSTLWPSATIAAWDSFIATATATSVPSSQAKAAAK